MPPRTFFHPLGRRHFVSHSKFTVIRMCVFVVCACVSVCAFLSYEARQTRRSNEWTDMATPPICVCVLERGEREREEFSAEWKTFLFIFSGFTSLPTPCHSPFTCTFYPKRDSASVSFHRFSTRRANNTFLYVILAVFPFSYAHIHSMLHPSTCTHTHRPIISTISDTLNF